MADINPGDVVRVSSSPGFKNASDVLTDPTTVTVRWRAPDGTVTTWVYGTDVEVIKDSTGLYHADIPVELAGIHYYGWIGTGAVVAAEEGSFTVVSYFDSLPA